MRINPPITLNDRERQLVRKLTNRIPRIRIEMPATHAEEKVKLEEPKTSVLDRLLRRKKQKVYPY